MTVATDLERRAGVTRRVFARIQGLNYDFWQKHSRAAAPSAGGDWRTPLECLDLADEVSNGLSLRDAEVELSGLTLYLENVYDSSANRVHKANDASITYLLAQIFAPGRNPAEERVYLRRFAESDGWVLPGDTAIYVDEDPANRGFASSGTAYIGGDAFSYTSTGTATAYGGETVGTFGGVTRGLYPAVGSSSFSKSVPIVTTGDSQLGPSVTPYPDTLFGRMAALYVTTLQDDGTWGTFANSELLWCGYIDHQINYDAKAGRFELACRSITESLKERELGVELPAAPLRGINLVDADRSIVVTYNTTRYTITVDAGLYTSTMLLAQEFVAKVNASVSFGLLSAEQLADSTIKYSVVPLAYDLEIDGGSDAARALGFAKNAGGTSRVSPSTPLVATPFVAYHAIGSSTCYTELRRAISDQGDHTSATAFVVFSKSMAAGDNGSFYESEGYVGRYTSVSGDPLALTMAAPVALNNDAWAGHRVGEDPCIVRTCFFAEMQQLTATALCDGPFGLWLRPLLSTGEADGAYNGSYDVCPPEFALGIPEDLVDAQSFLDADALHRNDAVAERQFVASQGKTLWWELLRREGMLFGYAVAFSRGKLRLKRFVFDSYIETLSSSTNADIEEMPVVSHESAETITSWLIKPYWNDAEDDEIDETITIQDSTARENVALRHQVELAHPGLTRKPDRDWRTSDSLAALGRRLASHLAYSWAVYLRYPLSRVDISLDPTYALRIGIGDTVRYQSSNHPDPYGGGSMSTDALGIVTNVAWSWANDQAWTGQATLLLLGRADMLNRQPWAPSALVDNTSGDGWQGTPDYYLALDAHAFGDSSQDSEDGDAFANGDEILLHWTHPTDPSSGEMLGPYTVDSYDSATNRLYLSGSPSITLTSGREYLVTFADWGDVATAQKTRATWQATTSTLKLSSDTAQLWGG